MQKLLLVAAIALVCSSMAFATTTDELQLVSGASTVTVLDNGSGDANPANGTIVYFNLNFNGWNIEVTSGTSNSPGLIPYGIDLAIQATDVSGASALDIWFGDINFTAPVPAGGFINGFSNTDAGGTATQYAWDDTTNTIFGTGTPIGTVGPITGAVSGLAVSGGGPAGPSAYALTLEDVLAAGSDVAYSVDGSITATPEPTSIVLFGTILSLGGFAFRRKLKKNS